MSSVPRSVVELVRTQHGAVSIEQLEDAGVTARRRRTLLTAGTISVVHRGVYRFCAVPESLEQRCAAACLADPRIAICGVTAGRLRNLRRMRPGPVHAMVNGSAAVQLDGAIVHRTNLLHPTLDVFVRPDGIRVLRVPRLVFDLARFLDDDDLESVIEQLLDRQLVDVPTLFMTGRRLRRFGRDGSARFGRVLARRPAWAKPRQSDLEVTLLNALSDAGVVLQPQFPIVLPDGSTVHLDGGDPARRFGVEVDHVTWHGGRIDSQYDKWRDRQVFRRGWLVTRVTDADIDLRLAATVVELVELYDNRSAA